jgi:hypothetical protein
VLLSWKKLTSQRAVPACSFQLVLQLVACGLQLLYLRARCVKVIVNTRFYDPKQLFKRGEKYWKIVDIL